MPMPGANPMMGGGAPPGAPPMGGGMPGMGGPGGDPQQDMALSALDQLNPKSANPTQALTQVEGALKMAHQLIMAAFPQISQWNPKLARDLHTIGRQILSTQLELSKETTPQSPPDMGMGGSPGMQGLPPGQGPLQGAPPGGMLG